MTSNDENGLILLQPLNVNQLRGSGGMITQEILKFTSPEFTGNAQFCIYSIEGLADFCIQFFIGN